MFEKILIADENITTRGKFYEVLSGMGYNVTCVPSGEEAILRLIDDRPSLIILSLKNPYIIGIDIAKKIREFDTDMKIVLLVSDKPTAEMHELAEQFNVQELVKKNLAANFMIADILEIVRLEKPPLAKTTDQDQHKGPILVVDDNPQIREILSDFLSNQGYDVKTAPSGDAALMKIKEKKPKIILLDMRMPGMDGLITLKQIKRLDKSIKVVMLTSAQEEYMINETMKLGASHYITKPCNLSELNVLLLALLKAEATN
ncbi:response regulator [Candidatus Omnitrophota bacterium]